METTRTMQGDTVDLVSHRIYGTHDMVGAILRANPGLAAHGLVLPIGTLIHLPPAQPRTIATLKLWD